MSFHEEWVLPEPIDTYTSDDLLKRVRSFLPDGVVVTLRSEPNLRTIEIRFEEAQVEDIASKLSERDGQLDWDWRDDMDPPRDGSKYDVHIDLVDHQGPLIRIYSNDGANREAWPIVFSVASTLAEDLGAIPEEDAPPSSDHIPMFIEPPRPGYRNGGSSKPN